jgi:hypothetical protein
MNEDEKLKQFNAEHDQTYTTPPLDLKNQGTQGQAPAGMTPEQQTILRDLEMKAKEANPDITVNAPPAPSYTPPPTTTTQVAMGGVCNECGMIHPPLREGETCPSAKLNLPSISDEDIGHFLSSIKNIIISQTEKNNVKDLKKLFQQSVVVLAKFLEEYKEEEENATNPTEAKQEASSNHQNP